MTSFNLEDYKRQLNEFPHISYEDYQQITDEQIRQDIAKKNKICPIEVKSSGYKTHASLDAFQEKYSSKIDECYLIYTKDFRRKDNILCIPIYMTMFL